MSKALVVIVIFCISIGAVGAATFGYIRYNDIVKQNNKLQSDLQTLNSAIKQLEKKFIQANPNSVSDYGEYKINDTTDILQRIEAIEKLVNASNTGINKNTQDNSVTKDNEPNSSQNPNTTNKYPLIIPDKKVFDEEVKNVVRDMIGEFMGQHVKSGSDRVLNLLEKELGLSPAQKENIAKVLEEQQKALAELWEKAREGNSTNLDFDKARQKAQEIQQQTENKITPYLDSAQLTKYNQLKSEGKINLFPRMGPPRPRQGPPGPGER